MAGFTPTQVPEQPQDPNSGNLVISGQGSFGSLNVSGIITSSGISNGTNTLSFTIVNSNLVISVNGVGSTSLSLS